MPNGQLQAETLSKVNLKTSVRTLKGVGPERTKILSRLGLHTLEDLFYFFPRRYEDRSPIKTISELSLGEKECVQGVVSSRVLIRTKHGQTIFRAVISDGQATLVASWFNQPYLRKVFMPKANVLFYGLAEKEGKRLRMIHPEYEIFEGPGPAETVHSGRIVPIYPLTEDLSQKGIRQLLFRAVGEFTALLKDPLSPSVKKALRLVDSLFAFKEIHFPRSFANFHAAYRRLVFDEFFTMQLAVQMKKNQLQKENKHISHQGGEEQVSEFVQSLDFELTEGQQAAIRDMIQDMKKGRSMNRLVQGDVGSGKTVVAAAGLVFTVANGFQGALMAPTEVLAQQHAFNLTQLLEPLGITCGYLAQGLSAEERERILSGLASGELQVVVGTHSLIQESVKFKKLGLAVIDEQHKFGVFQRATLKQKGEDSHFLLMTATPIPRTLALTLYGDLDISVIAELPKGRRPIKTFWVGDNQRQEVYGLLDNLIQKGGQGYVICPLIDEEKEFSPKSVLAAHQELSKIFAHRKVGILHGRMKSPEKKKIMQDFKEGAIQLLVSTVVIEVGVDVPNANIMIIENAEQFGLAQLHQLRGRVGRGTEESFCVLFSNAAGEESAERLKVFEETQSGFDIAEKDLDFRGAGDIIGEKQHGLPQLRIGDLSKDIELLEIARRQARAVIEVDPRLERPGNRPLKRLLRERFGVADEKLTVLA